MEDDNCKTVLRDRKERGVKITGGHDVVLDRQQALRQHAKHRRRIRERTEQRDWPIYALTGERADLDPHDVLAPLPEDMIAPLGDIDEEMVELRAEADATPSAFDGDIVQIDETLLIHRRAEAAREREATSLVRGPAWTEALVDARIEEAYRTLSRISVGGGIGPREFGNAMPQIVREVSDLVHQAGNKSLRNMLLHRFHGIPTIEQIKRADASLGWAMKYLRDQDPDFALFFNLGGLWKAWGAKVTKKCESMGIRRQDFYRDRKIALRLIVEGLKQDGEAPT